MSAARIDRQLLDDLHTRAMLLMDEARGTFERLSRDDGASAPEARVLVASEGLRTTARLMYVVSWVLAQKAVGVGEMSEADAAQWERGTVGGRETLVSLPAEAVRVAGASIDLWERIDRLQPQPPVLSGARALLAQLQTKL